MTTILVCECHSVEHQVVIQQVDNEVYFNIYLDSLPFWRRLALAIRYAFGYKSSHGQWAEFIINPDDADKLQGVVDALRAKYKTSDTL